MTAEVKGAGKRMEFESDFAGRDQEMETMMKLLDWALDSQGNLAFVTGEAGIGKTRLVEEVIKKATEKGFQPLTGKCLYQEGSDPYLPFIETLKSYLSGSEEEDDVQYRIPMGLTAMSFDDTPGNSRREIMPMGLMGFDSDDDKTEKHDERGPKNIMDIDFTKERDKMFSTVSYLLRDLSLDKPVLFFLDDLHWADAATLQLLTYIARNIKDVKVVMICAYRTEELEMGGRKHPLRETLQIMSREHLFTEVRLQRITIPAVETMIKSLLKGSSLPRGFTEAVFKETEGNPYFVEEVIKALVTDRIIDIDDENWHHKFELSSVKIPSTVNDLVVRRIENLEPETKKVLEIASIIGDDFTLDVLNGVSGMSEEVVIDLLDDLIENKLLKEEVGSLVDRYRFTHKLIREVTYTRLSRAKKRLLHKRVGEMLEKVPEKVTDKEIYSLAYHYFQGNVVDKAIKYTILAGDKASTAFAAEDAIRFYNRTIELLEKTTPSKENDEKKVNILTKIGDLHYMIGEWDRALDYYYLMERLANKIENMKMVGLANRKMGQVERLRGHWDGAEEHYNSALVIAKKYGDDVGRADSERGLGYIHWRRGEFDDAIKHFEDSLEISKGIGDRFVTGRTYIELGNVLSERGILEGAEFHYTTAIEILTQIKDHMEVARAYNNLGDVYMKKEQWEEALQYLQKSYDLSKKLGDPHMLSWALFNIAECYSKSGRVDKAEPCLEESKAMLMESDDSVGQAFVFIEYGIMYRFKKDWEKSLENFRLGLKILEELKVPPVEAYAYSELGNMYLDKGEPQMAVSWFEKAITIYEHLNAPIFVQKLKTILTKLRR